ncbi:MAG: hypothetical protein [Caudoviricetes sp.]|nr:MAG: hypothetical protein [Caudoviricetes sp.]
MISSANNYVVRFKGEKKAKCLMLCKTPMKDFSSFDETGIKISYKLIYFFVDLETGEVLITPEGLKYYSPEEAEDFLETKAEILLKNEICTTYIP